MSQQIQDGKGTGNRAKVSGNRLFTHGVVETEIDHATEEGDAYNLNTGTIGLTAATVSAVMYCKNNETRDLIITAIAAGIDSAGTTPGMTTIKIIRNPTSVDFSTAADMNANRNFGSSKTLTADVYKGVEGSTVTGGTEIIQFFTNPGSRLFAPIDLILTKGDSICITMDTDTSSGTTNVYAALICHLKEDAFKED